MNSSTPTPDLRAGELMLAYLADNLDASGTAELNRALKANPGLRREFARLLVQESLLRQIGEMETAETPALAEPRSRADAFRDACSRWVSALVRFRWRLAIGFGTVTAAVLVLWLFSLEWPAADPVLSSVTGEVLVQRDGAPRSARAGVHLRSGDGLILAPDAAAAFRFGREPTQIRLSGAAKLHLAISAQGKTLSLEDGLLSAIVAPQPGTRPLRVITPQAEITVLGTQFELRAGRQMTRLEVWQGRVRLTRTADGAVAELGPGQALEARAGAPLQPEPIRLGAIREYWLGLGPDNPGDLNALVRSAGAPSGWELLPSLDAPVNWNDQYLARVRTFLRPAVTGPYQFWVAGDDRAELWLSRDQSPGHKTKLCWTSQWTPPGDFDRAPSQQSAPVLLEAGQKYYLELLHLERGGPDSAGAAWSPPGQPRQPLPPECLAPGPLPQPARPALGTRTNHPG